MAEANTALAFGKFQNSGNIMPNLDVRGKLAIQFMENTIVTETGDIGSPIRDCRRSQIVEFKLDKVLNYHRKWIASEKKSKYTSRNMRSSDTITVQNAATELVTFSYSK